MNLKNLIIGSAIAIGMTGCGINYTPERFDWAEIEAPNDIYQSYTAEETSKSKFHWRAYQELFREVNGFRFDKNVPKGTLIKLPDLDNNGYIVIGKNSIEAIIKGRDVETN